MCHIIPFRTPCKLSVRYCPDYADEASLSDQCLFPYHSPGAYNQPVQVPGKFIFMPVILFYKIIIKVFDHKPSLNHCVAGHSITLLYRI